MKLSAYSLKTGIFAILVIILLLAMILLDIVVIRIAERDLLKAEIKRGIVLLRTIEQDMVTSYKKQAAIYPTYKSLRHLLDETRFSAAIIMNGYGKVLFETEIRQEDRKTLVSQARKSLQSGENSTFISGARWRILPIKRGALFLASPIMHEKRIVGAACVHIPLRYMYITIIHSQKILLSYILLNTLFLALFGFYLIYRSTIRPINRLVRRAEEFKGGEAFFLSPETEQNEFGKLSRALNLMLRRLEDNREELKSSITSLEVANLELRQAQEEIIRSEKLASVGRLASGVAHEIGNPIGIVLGYIDLLKGNDLKKGDRRDFINRIENEIDRINRTIKNLLDFSRPSKGEVREVSVHQTIVDMLDMLKPQPMMSDIEVVLDHQATKDTVLADPDKLKQVFLNILMNAIDSMEADQTKDGSQDKVLSIRTRVVSETQPDRRKNGNRVQIEFIDNGPGIQVEDLNRVFDPFYTTKEPGKGTGLGLSVSLRIVEDMGGDITAKSEEGKGTTLIVILPLYGNSK
jgi:signal transduction histidine kinase